MKLKIFGILCVMSLVAVPVMADDNVEYADTIEEIDDNDLYEYDDMEYEIPFDETRGVSERLSCAEINERISDLREDVKMYPESQQELDDMMARWRSQCAPVANRRPVRNYLNVHSVPLIDTESISVTAVEEPDVEETVVESEPEKTSEDIEAELAAMAETAAENSANGLCADGENPNRYGCCAGYKFREVSQMKFACCPEIGDCMEPIVKK